MPDVNIRARDLEALDTTLYTANQYELTARRLIRLKTDIPAGAELYTYKIMSRAGVAKIIGNRSNDLPFVTTQMEDRTQKVYSVAVGYEVTVQEVRAAQMSGVNLDTTRAEVARRAVAEKENKIAFIGDADYNIKGLTNATGIQTQAVDNNAGGTSARWADKTGEEIVEDIRKLRKLITVLPGHNVPQNLTLAVESDSYEDLNKRYNATDARTVLEVIRSYNWFGTIESVPELNGVGVGGTNSFMIFDNSPSVIELGIPMDIMRHDPEWNFPTWKFAVEERTTGVIIRYPMAIARGDGI